MRSEFLKYSSSVAAMDNGDQEDYGITIHDIPDEDDEAKEKLKQFKNLPNEISLGSWTPSSEIVPLTDATVGALLVRSTDGKGVVRIVGKPHRYTKTDRMSEKESRLLILGPGEKFLLLGSLLYRVIRYPRTQE